jgi:hypothetical protein
VTDKLPQTPSMPEPPRPRPPAQLPLTRPLGFAVPEKRGGLIPIGR